MTNQDAANTDPAPPDRGEMPLFGRSALITGSTGGLGLAVAEALAESGASVMVHGVEPEAETADMVSGLAGRTGARITYRRADLSSPQEAERLVDATCEAFGTLDILVNNAVVRHFAPAQELSPDAWETALAVNLSAAFYAIRRALPGMRDRDYGRIFNMTSVYGLRGAPNRIGYLATKSALMGVTRGIALENLDRDVTCHGLCPGSVLTPDTDARVRQLIEDKGCSRAEAEKTFLEKKQPSGRFVSPSSVTALLLFLCGPAARDMTGALMPVEAGWLAS